MLSHNRQSARIVVVVLLVSVLACGFGSGDLLPATSEVRERANQEEAPVPKVNTAPPPDSAYDTLDALDAAIVPPRDRLDLAERLRGVSPDDIDPPQPRTYAIGDHETFWADNSDTDEVLQVEAVLRYMTSHLYMWVQDGVPYDQADLEASADLFEEQIYPTDRKYFGSESSPGIDGDERLHVLHTADIAATVAGYYSSQSQYPAVAVPYSNEREMFFINISNTFPNTSFYDGVLAHEFQHMIHWNVDRNEESWVNEGLSEVAVLLNGLETESEEVPFVTNPDLQLTDWPESDGGRAANYAASYLFHTYYLDRFGDEALRALVRNPKNGLEGVEDTLAELAITDPQTGEPITVEDFFADWVITNYVNDPSLGDGRYAYHRLPSFVRASAADVVIRLPVEDSKTVHQFGTDYIELPVEDRLRITFDGSQQVQLMATDIYDTDRDPATDDRFAWWSNRGDDSDMTLTASFDLTSVTNATLDYDLWYFIEENWDYGYLMVSEDDGATWTVLETPHTSDLDPHGTGYGPGYTGSSIDQLGADDKGWLHETIDLNAYTGREILLRFEMITDDAVNQPGMLIDNVRLDVIGFFDDAETDSGAWDARGFVRHDNVLPQEYVVQVLALGGEPKLERLALDENNHGEWTFEPGPDADSVVLVVSGVTSFTNEIASYSYSVRAE